MIGVSSVFRNGEDGHAQANEVFAQVDGQMLEYNLYHLGQVIYATDSCDC
jgi:hypothetical protein